MPPLQNKPGNIIATNYIITFFAGLIISLLGALPLGNLNITALHIASTQNLRKALWFAAGVVIVEVVYLSITLIAINQIISNKAVFAPMQWLSVLILLALAMGCFIAAYQKSTKTKNVLIDNKLTGFVLGVIMSAVNPMQIPFWVGWSVYAQTHQLLYPTNLSYLGFTIGVGCGTLLALLLFIAVGKQFSALLIRKQKMVQLIMGLLFLTIAIFQAISL